MDYTFGQAKELLKNAAHAQHDEDLGTKINEAVQSLAGLAGWEFMRKLVRISTTTPVFTLPQGAVALTRLCVNGRPASLHATDYQFLHSGPGDLSRNPPPPGFNFVDVSPRTSDVADMGFLPFSTPASGPMKFAATVQGEASGVVTIYGIDTKGTPLAREITIVTGDSYGVPEDSAFDEYYFSHVTDVVIPEGAIQYITLFGMSPENNRLRLAEYHPNIIHPKFHAYQFAGPRLPYYDMIAEIRFDPLPLVNDSDVVPVASLEPIKHMLLYDACLNMNELQTAQQYVQQATSWIQQMKVTDDTIQTPVVSNTFFEGSVGELSELYRNI